MSTTKTQTGVSKATATSVISQSIPLNAKVGAMGYRIGTTDRMPGEVSNQPDGFVVLNQSNGNVFQSIGGKWCTLGPIGNLDAIDPTLLPAWKNTVPSGPPGYRVTNTDRTGSADGYPNGFLILNQTTGSAFTVSGGTLSGGVWSGGTWGPGTFSKALTTAWLENEGVTYVRSGNQASMTGKAKIG